MATRKEWRKLEKKITKFNERNPESHVICMAVVGNVYVFAGASHIQQYFCQNEDVKQYYKNATAEQPLTSMQQPAAGIDPRSCLGEELTRHVFDMDTDMMRSIISAASGPGNVITCGQPKCRQVQLFQLVEALQESMDIIPSPPARRPRTEFRSKFISVEQEQEVEQEEQQGQREAEQEEEQQGRREAEQEEGQQGRREAEQEEGQQGRREAEQEEEQQGRREAEREEGQQGRREAEQEEGQQGRQEAEQEEGQQGQGEGEQEESVSDNVRKLFELLNSPVSMNKFQKACAMPIITLRSLISKLVHVCACIFCNCLELVS